MPPLAKAARPGIQSVARTAEILRLLAGSRRRLGVVELARDLGVPTGTVHGILRTLQLEGFVEQDPDSGKYQVGPALLAIGFAYLQASRLRSAGLNAAYALAARSGESVRVGALHRGAVLIVITWCEPTAPTTRLTWAFLHRRTRPRWERRC